MKIYYTKAKETAPNEHFFATAQEAAYNKVKEYDKEKAKEEVAKWQAEGTIPPHHEVIFI